MEIVDGKYLIHRYFGKAIRTYRGTAVPRYFKRGYATEHPVSIENASFDDLGFEYPLRGHGDFRIPAFAVTQESGVTYADLTFRSLRIYDGVPIPPGCPISLPERIRPGKTNPAKTLEIICEDKETPDCRSHCAIPSWKTAA